MIYYIIINILINYEMTLTKINYTLVKTFVTLLDKLVEPKIYSSNKCFDCTDCDIHIQLNDVDELLSHNVTCIAEKKWKNDKEVIHDIVNGYWYKNDDAWGCTEMEKCLRNLSDIIVKTNDLYLLSLIETLFIHDSIFLNRCDDIVKRIYVMNISNNNLDYKDYLYRYIVIYEAYIIYECFYKNIIINNENNNKCFLKELFKNGSIELYKKIYKNNNYETIQEHIQLCKEFAGSSNGFMKFYNYLMNIRQKYIKLTVKTLYDCLCDDLIGLLVKWI